MNQSLNQNQNRAQDQAGPRAEQDDTGTEPAGTRAEDDAALIAEIDAELAAWIEENSVHYPVTDFLYNKPVQEQS